MHDRFEHILHEKLRDHAVKPEPRDWTAIERSLGLDVKTRRTVPLWRLAAVAAVLLLVVGGFYLRSRAPKPLVEVVAATDTHTPVFAQPAVSVDQTDEALVAVQNLKKAIERAAPPALSVVGSAQEQVVPAAVQEIMQPTENKYVALGADTPGVVAEGSRRYATPPVPPSRPARVSRTPNGNWALSLFANGMGRNRGGPSAEHMLADYLSQDQDSPTRLASAMFSSDYLIQYDQSRGADLLSAEVADWEHALPLSAGFRVRRRLTKRWGVETGLTYTYLSSKQETSALLRKQQLHYLGFPLAVTYTPLRTPSFELYARAGGAADLNIAGRLHTSGASASAERFTHRQVQWSLAANVGAMYRVTPALGLYLEPGVSHHFEFTGQPESHWTENPTGFNLQIGIRADF